MPDTVLVIAAHSDDEVIGMGGTLLKHRDLGDSVNVIFMTDGVSSRNNTNPEASNSSRLTACELAAKIINFDNLTQLSFPDNAMDSVPLLEIVQEVEQCINQLKPNIIYTHCSSDLNIDHQITHRATITACRPQPGFCVEKILTFEVRSATEWQATSLPPFSPNYFVNISQYKDEKIALLNCYKQELRPFPHSRSMEAIMANGQVRGAQCGMELAEAFYIERWLQK